MVEMAEAIRVIIVMAVMVLEPAYDFVVVKKT
jgi:hypothetical protein